LEVCLLFLAAFLAGALNSVAGGGSFISFPTLVRIGHVPDINGSATNTVALWPGSAASVGAYRRELTTQRRVLLPLGAASLIGGLFGAELLLGTPEVTFQRMVPFLLLFATLLFTFGGQVTNWVRARTGRAAPDSGGPALGTLLGISLIQFMTAVYGGFFGGGIGIVMLATLRVMGMDNIHEMNALKNLLATFINGVATITFIVSGAVWWPQALLMISGAILGGFGGAYYARKIDPRRVRVFVILVGFTMTFYFFFLRR
jgi:hypothetical protein